VNTLLIAAVVLTGAPSGAEVRLAGLARVWAYVKYVHPAMATSSVDWDTALVRALPAVESASSDAAYRAAIASLLEELQDPATRVLPREEPPAPGNAVASGSTLRIEPVDPRTAVVVVPNGPELESTPDLQSEVCARFAEAVRSERVVVDLRSPTGRRPGWILQGAIVKCAGRLLGQDVTLPPARYATHGFYMMQSVVGGAGGGLGPWESGLTVASAGSVRAEGARIPHLAFLVDRGTADVYPLLMALQGEGLAVVVQEGEIRGAGIMVTTFDAGNGLNVEVRHGERLRRDGGAGFAADAIVPAGGTGRARDRALELLDAPRRVPAPAGPLPVPYEPGAFVERDESETTYPDREHRLLALFRLYGAIEYFFPYKDLMDRPWKEMLAALIPRFAEARDATDYALAVAEAAVRIQDSHVTLASPVLDAYFGTHRPDVRVDLVEGQTVITEVAAELAPTGLAVGDVVVSVDGEGAGARRERLARYLPASTPGRLQNKTDVQFLLGPRGKPAVIEARGAEGTPRRVTVARTLEGLAPRSRTRRTPAYGLHAPGFGYVDLQRLEAKDVGDAFETIRNTPGLILDMRGYPIGGAFGLVARLARRESPPAFLGGSIRYDGTTATFSLDESLVTEDVPGPGYAGRVVLLADGSTQSAAEHVCALIKSSLETTVIGSPTSGANGGVTRTILPGGIVVNFTGQSMRHKDGTRLQRVGIVPDVEVRPTLAGVRAGRDEVLERAVAFLERATSVARP
jgi:C-terminal processing protease CtpA/Prc